MNNSRQLQIVIIFIVVAIIGIWMGSSLATDQAETMIKCAAAFVLLIAMVSGSRVWIFMLALYYANIVLLQGIGTKEIGQMLFLTFSITAFMMRRLKLNYACGELEFWAMLIILSIVQTYARNPAGLNLFGGDSVGGKPYVILALSILSFSLLSMLKVDPKDIKLAMKISLLGNLGGIPANYLISGITGGGGEGRFPVLNDLGQFFARWLVTYISPLRALFHPFWVVILLLALGCAAGSAYRNAVAAVGLTLAVGLAYRSGYIGMLITGFVSTGALIFLAVVNTVSPLPPNVQRALSPLPGNWDKAYVQDAELSSDWRYEMWKEALTSEKWIHNKVLGDGVGMTAEQFKQTQMVSSMFRGASSSGLLYQQENMLINGSYHSGPVHSIRAVGYVGFVILLFAMIRTAVHGHRLIMRCKNTEWFRPALFFCIPAISHPIFFVFIFGEYQSGVATTMLCMAMIRLMEKNIFSADAIALAQGGLSSLHPAKA
jgi:hypothetical protein